MYLKDQIQNFDYHMDKDLSDVSLNKMNLN
jgi:hypothetical protein